VDPRAGLDGYGKSYHHRDSAPGPSLSPCESLKLSVQYQFQGQALANAAVKRNNGQNCDYERKKNKAETRAVGSTARSLCERSKGIRLSARF
jgi:hypothetical protein